MGALLCFCRAGKVEAAVSLARTDLAPLRGRFLGRSEEFDAMLHDVVALLAYTEPEVLALTTCCPIYSVTACTKAYILGNVP